MTFLFDGLDNNLLRTVRFEDILAFSKNKEDLEDILASKKYNL